LKRGFGWADVQSERPVTAQTVFNVGELSTMMTGWGVLYLVAEGKIALEAPVEVNLGGWTFPPSDFDHSEVTFERLLRHRGGTSLESYPGFSLGTGLPTVQESLSGATNGAGDVRIVYAPLSKTQYSAGGMTAIQLAIDQAVEINFLSYRTHIEENILRPLGIVSSRFLISPSVSSALATPYGEDGEAVEQRQFTAHAAAGLMTTLEDMITFAEAYISMFHGRSFQTPGFGQAALISMLNTATDPAPTYEFGHQVRRIGGIGLIGQIGGITGWRAHFQVDPEQQNAIVVLMNSSNGEPVGNALICRWIEEAVGVSSTEFCRA